MEIEIPDVSVIIPAFNEEKWIKKTVSSILESGFPCEIVVVDDGSTDKTLERLKGFGEKIKIVVHDKNRGKGAALASGIRNASGEIVIFCDAHLLGLDKTHLLFLVLPLVFGKAKAVIGCEDEEKCSLFEIRSPLWILSGQRAYFKKDLLPFLDKFEGLGYGVEIFLYHRFKDKKVVVVPLPGLVHLIKNKTSSSKNVALSYLRELKEIFATLTKIENLTPLEFKELKETINSLWQDYLSLGQQRVSRYLKSLKKFFIK
jgi:glycosyltransferase involved in cell wall biosynthesis